MLHTKRDWVFSYTKRKTNECLRHQCRNIYFVYFKWFL